MNVQPQPSYILGQSSTAEHRLEILNELTTPNFVRAMSVLPNRNIRILNIGCGSGHLEEQLSYMFINTHFIGIDISAKRIEEAMIRAQTFNLKNTYQFIQADLTTISIDELGPCDILISRFVLSHLISPLKQLEKFIPLVKKGGTVCIEEVASDGSEYYSNKENPGYNAFIKMVDIQIESQKSNFDTGFRILSFLSKRPGKLHYCQVSQAVLNSLRHKSILRLGIEDAKSTFIKKLKEEDVKAAISSLREFEEDPEAFGLYTRTLSIIFQIPRDPSSKNQ